MGSSTKKVPGMKTTSRSIKIRPSFKNSVYIKLRYFAVGQSLTFKISYIPSQIPWALTPGYLFSNLSRAESFEGNHESSKKRKLFLVLLLPVFEYKRWKNSLQPNPTHSNNKKEAIKEGSHRTTIFVFLFPLPYFLYFLCTSIFWVLSNYQTILKERIPLLSPRKLELLSLLSFLFWSLCAMKNAFFNIIYCFDNNKTKLKSFQLKLF